MRARPLGIALLCAMGAAASSVAADEVRGGRVRLAGNRVELVIALSGAAPVDWRACHPSCARADAGSGSSVRFVTDGDSPPIRLIIRDLEPPIDLQALRYSAEVSENERSRIATLQADLPVAGVRLVKSFEVPRDGYEIVMTARLAGPGAAAFMSGRRLELELSAGRGLLPPPAAGFAAMLERMSRVVVAHGAVHEIGDDHHEPTVPAADDWLGFRSRFWTMLVRSDGGRLAPRPGANAPLSLSD